MPRSKCCSAAAPLLALVPLLAHEEMVERGGRLESFGGAALLLGLQPDRLAGSGTAARRRW